MNSKVVEFLDPYDLTIPDDGRPLTRSYWREPVGLELKGQNYEDARPRSRLAFFCRHDLFDLIPQDILAHLTKEDWLLEYDPLCSRALDFLFISSQVNLKNWKRLPPALIHSITMEEWVGGKFPLLLHALEGHYKFIPLSILKQTPFSEPFLHRASHKDSIPITEIAVKRASFAWRNSSEPMPPPSAEKHIKESYQQRCRSRQYSMDIILFLMHPVIWQGRRDEYLDFYNQIPDKLRSKPVEEKHKTICSLINRIPKRKMILQ